MATEGRSHSSRSLSAYSDGSLESIEFIQHQPSSTNLSLPLPNMYDPKAVADYLLHICSISSSTRTTTILGDTSVSTVVHEHQVLDDTDIPALNTDDENESINGIATIEGELENIAAALKIATQIKEEIQIKMLFKGTQQMDLQEKQAEESPTKFKSYLNTKEQYRRSSPIINSTANYGIPTVNAPARLNSHCMQCQKYFSAFHRSKVCRSCGYSFCPKCANHKQILPLCFGQGNRPVRVCQRCVSWFQNALDRYFDLMDLSKQTYTAGTPSPIVTSLQRDIVLPPYLLSEAIQKLGFSNDFVSTTDINAEDNEVPIRRRRESSISSYQSSMSINSPTEFEDNLDETSNSMSDSLQIAVDKPTSGSFEMNESQDPILTDRGFVSSDGEENVHDDDDFDEDNFNLEGTLMIPQHSKLQTDDKSSSDESTTKRKSRCGKFSRSLSYDFTSLSTSGSHGQLNILDESDMTKNSSKDRVQAGVNSAPHSSRRLQRAKSVSQHKCFDDSDIDDHQLHVESDKNTASITDLDLPATVLRFTVYEVGTSKSNSMAILSSSRRNKTCQIIDRYTLELDCTRGIVQVKSVFMHRFWWFHCDEVQRITFSSTYGQIAYIDICTNGNHSQILELQFGTADERAQFRDAVDAYRSVGLMPPSEVLDREKPHDHASDANACAGGCADEYDLVVDIEGRKIPQWLAGEHSQMDVEGTFLMGPGGDSGEMNNCWGRLAGTVYVTNYRVLFVPLENGSVPFQPLPFSQLGYSSMAFIPLFAIASLSVLRRQLMSQRRHGFTLPRSIVVINCKDVRVMRIEVSGNITESSERARALHDLISRLSDNSQRYSKIAANELRCSCTMVATQNQLQLGVLSSSESVNSSEVDTGDSVSNENQSNRWVPWSANPEPGNRETVSHTTAKCQIVSVSEVLDNHDPQEKADFAAITADTREVSGSFAYSYDLTCFAPENNGWTLFSDYKEFHRQISDTSDNVAPFLKLFHNETGSICKTYPAQLLLPASMNSEIIADIVKFRAKGRIPTITYYHKRNRCVLTRSGQPLLGRLLSGNSNLSDQNLIGYYRRFPEIIRSQQQSVPSSRPIYIFDCRKLKASTGNRIMGKGGVETPQDYNKAVICHLNIANMYRMQSSFQALQKLLLPGGTEDHDSALWTSVESSRWLGHVRLILEGALKIARVLELEGASVLVHCSDGWDRTAQLTALAQIMIDPYYRTIQGFAVLVEKDFCSFGHKFAERLGGDRNRDPQRQKSSPVMFQFLDAVWQLQRQFPYAFEFNDQFLLFLANSLTSGQFGTFLYDFRIQRDMNDVKHNSVSVWTPVLMDPVPFTNTKYVLWNKPIWPWTGSQMIRLWEDYFFQWHPKYYNCRWSVSLLHSGSHHMSLVNTSNTASSTSRRGKDESVGNGGSRPILRTHPGSHGITTSFGSSGMSVMTPWQNPIYTNLQANNSGAATPNGNRRTSRNSGRSIGVGFPKRIFSRSDK